MFGSFGGKEKSPAIGRCLSRLDFSVGCEPDFDLVIDENISVIFCFRTILGL